MLIFKNISMYIFQNVFPHIIIIIIIIIITSFGF